MILIALAIFVADQARAAVVNCLDTARDLVTRTLAGDCAGAVISDAEAETRRDQRRQRVLDSQGTRRNTDIKGYGTGLIVGTDGEVLTSLHTVAACAGLRLLDVDGRETDGRLKARDQSNDLALISSDFTGRSVARFEPAPLADGDVLTLTGYPFRGMIPRLPTTLRAEIPVRAAPPGQVPVAAPIRLGHSGSPLLDDAGQVRGIIRAKVNTPRVFAMTGEIIKNIGVAVPAASVLDFLAKHGLPRYSGGRRGVSVVRVDCL